MNKAEHKRLGDYIREVDVRNRDLAVTRLVGLTIDKAFIPSVANVIGTDLSNYKVIRREQFACSLMQVSRDGKMPVAMFEEDAAIMSPAYPMFEVIDSGTLLPKYLMMWFSRPEFDREASFYAVGGVRGSLTWEDFCDLKLPIPPLSRQREIVAEYETLTRRIRLNERLIASLESLAQTLYRRTFVDDIDPAHLPPGWKKLTLGDVSSLITKGTTPQEMCKDFSVKMVRFIKGEAISEKHYINASMLSYIDEGIHVGILKRSIIEKEDILFTIAGTLGKFAFVEDNDVPANANQAVSIIRINKEIISPRVIFSFFLGGFHVDYCQRNIQQAVQANLSLETISGLPVLLPPKDILECYEIDICRVLCMAFMKRRERKNLEALRSLLLSVMLC